METGKRVPRRSSLRTSKGVEDLTNYRAQAKDSGPRRGSLQMNKKRSSIVKKSLDEDLLLFGTLPAKTEDSLSTPLPALISTPHKKPPSTKTAKTSPAMTLFPPSTFTSPSSSSLSPISSPTHTQPSLEISGMMLSPKSSDMFSPFQSPRQVGTTSGKLTPMDFTTPTNANSKHLNIPFSAKHTPLESPHTLNIPFSAKHTPLESPVMTTSKPTNSIFASPTSLAKNQQTIKRLLLTGANSHTLIRSNSDGIWGDGFNKQVSTGLEFLQSPSKNNKVSQSAKKSAKKKRMSRYNTLDSRSLPGSPNAKHQIAFNTVGNNKNRFIPRGSSATKVRTARYNARLSPEKYVQPIFKSPSKSTFSSPIKNTTKTTSNPTSVIISSPEHKQALKTPTSTTTTPLTSTIASIMSSSAPASSGVGSSLLDVTSAFNFNGISSAGSSSHNSSGSFSSPNSRKSSQGSEDFSTGRITREGIQPSSKWSPRLSRENSDNEENHPININSRSSSRNDMGYTGDSDKENKTPPSPPSPSSPLSEVCGHDPKYDSPTNASLVASKLSQPASPIVRPHHPYPKTPNLPTRFTGPLTFPSPDSSRSRQSRAKLQRSVLSDVTPNFAHTDLGNRKTSALLLGRWISDDDDENTSESTTPEKPNNVGRGNGRYRRRDNPSPSLIPSGGGKSSSSGGVPFSVRFDKAEDEKSSKKQSEDGMMKKSLSRPRKSEMYSGLSWIRSRPVHITAWRRNSF